MIHKNLEISSKQLFVFIISAQIGIGALTLPSTLAQKTGHDSWIPVLLAGAASLIAIFFIVKLLERYKDKNILEINKLLYGKILGYLFNLVMVAYFFFASFIGVRLFSDFMKISALRQTPPLILTSVALIPTIYLTWYGIKSICRFAGVVFFLHLSLVIFILLLLRHMRIILLLPIGESGFTPILAGFAQSIFAFLGFELLMLVYPNISDKENVMKYAFLANLYTTILYLIIILACTTFFGEELLRRLIIPVFSLFRSYKAPVLERLDLFFIMLWFPAMASSFRKYVYCCYVGGTALLPIKNLKLYTAVLFILIVLASRIPKDLHEVLAYMDSFSRLAIGIILFLVFSLGFSFINQRGVAKVE